MTGCENLDGRITYPLNERFSNALLCISGLFYWLGYKSLLVNAGLENKVMFMDKLAVRGVKRCFDCRY